MRKTSSIVLAIALCTGWSTAQAAKPIEIKLHPDTIKAFAEMLTPPPKSHLARTKERIKGTAEIVGWSTGILSAFASFCYAWEPCNETAAYTASEFNFNYPNDDHRAHDHE